MIEKHFKVMRWRTRAWHALHLFALFGAAFVAARYSAELRSGTDVTRSQTYTLSAASATVAEQFTSPVHVTAYLSSEHPGRGQVEHLIDRYRRHAPHIKLEFVDPGDDPAALRTSAIDAGDLVFEYLERRERTETYSEQTITETLARLARAEDRWIVFVNGHGERSPRRGANHDLSAWVTVLEKRGLKIQEINLAEFRDVPNNTSVLVIASPQIDFQPVETRALLEYIESGGNLLWFAEPDTPQDLTTLEKALGFTRIPGTVVDPLSVAHGLDNPAFIVSSHYAKHPATSGFNYTTVLFYAAGINAQPNDGWRATNLISSSEKAWSEREALEGNVDFDDTEDTLGPLPLAVALTRDIEDHEQRIMVIGDGDFLANTYLQNSGNQELGVRFMEWLSHDDTFIEIPSRTALDATLALSDWQKATIGFAFLFVLPGILLINGLRVWRRRSRA